MSSMTGYAKAVDDDGVVIAAWPYCEVAINGSTELRAPVLNAGRPTRFIMGAFECALSAGYCYENCTLVVSVAVRID